MEPAGENRNTSLVSDSEGPLLDEAFLKKIEQLTLVSRKVVMGKIHGERLTRKRGQSVEFADYRQYAPGDDLRMIDWNIFGRLERLFLKLFFEEEDLHVYILVDSSASMRFGKPSKLYYAKKVAAALGYIALANFDRVALGTFSEGRPRMMRALRGKRSVMRLLDFLARATADGATDAESSLKSFAMTHRTKGVVILVSDLLDKSGHESALRYLMAGAHDVFVIQVLAPEEMEPQFAGDLTLVDAEDSDETEITVSAPLLRAYRETLNTFLASVKDYCTRRGMTHIVAPTTLPLETLVLDFLRKRGVIE
jgi:uncharacterized protein (DUF58 family)